MVIAKSYKQISVDRSIGVHNRPSFVQEGEATAELTTITTLSSATCSSQTIFQFQKYESDFGVWKGRCLSVGRRTRGKLINLSGRNTEIVKNTFELSFKKQQIRVLKRLWIHWNHWSIRVLGVANVCNLRSSFGCWFQGLVRCENLSFSCGVRGWTPEGRKKWNGWLLTCWPTVNPPSNEVTRRHAFTSLSRLSTWPLQCRIVT